MRTDLVRSRGSTRPDNTGARPPGRHTSGFECLALQAMRCLMSPDIRATTEPQPFNPGTPAFRCIRQRPILGQPIYRYKHVAQGMFRAPSPPRAANAARRTPPKAATAHSDVAVRGSFDRVRIHSAACRFHSIAQSGNRYDLQWCCDAPAHASEAIILPASTRIKIDIHNNG